MVPDTNCARLTTHYEKLLGWSRTITGGAAHDVRFIPKLPLLSRTTQAAAENRTRPYGIQIRGSSLELQRQKGALAQ